LTHKLPCLGLEQIEIVERQVNRRANRREGTLALVDEGCRSVRRSASARRTMVEVCGARLRAYASLRCRNAGVAKDREREGETHDKPCQVSRAAGFWYRRS